MSSRVEPLTLSLIVAELMKRQRGLGAAFSSSQSVVPRDESFTVTANGQTTCALAALPIEGSVHVSARRPLVEGEDFTVDYDTGVVTLSVTVLATPAPADIVDVHYLTTGELVAQTLSPEVDPTVLFAWNFDTAPTTPAWTVANGTYYGTGSPRNGTAIGWQSDCHAYKTFATAYPTLACGIALRSPGATAPTRWWVADTDADDFGLMSFCGDSGATCHVYLETGSDSVIRAYRGQRGTLLATASAAFDTSTVGLYQYLEAEVTVHDTAGRVQVWIEGTRVMDFTGDTRNGGTSDLDTVKLGGYYPDNLITDDLYIATGRYGDPGDVTPLM